MYCLVCNVNDNNSLKFEMGRKAIHLMSQDKKVARLKSLTKYRKSDRYGNLSFCTRQESLIYNQGQELSSNRI